MQMDFCSPEGRLSLCRVRRGGKASKVVERAKKCRRSAAKAGPEIADSMLIEAIRSSATPPPIPWHNWPTSDRGCEWRGRACVKCNKMSPEKRKKRENTWTVRFQFAKLLTSRSREAMFSTLSGRVALTRKTRRRPFLKWTARRMSVSRLRVR